MSLKSKTIYYQGEAYVYDNRASSNIHFSEFYRKQLEALNIYDVYFCAFNNPKPKAICRLTEEEFELQGEFYNPRNRRQVISISVVYGITGKSLNFIKKTIRRHDEELCSN